MSSRGGKLFSHFSISSAEENQFRFFIVIFPANELIFLFLQWWKNSNPYCCRQKNNWVRERSMFMHTQRHTTHTGFLHTQAHIRPRRPAHKQITNINVHMLFQIHKYTLRPSLLVYTQKPLNRRKQRGGQWQCCSRYFFNIFSATSVSLLNSTTE